VCLEPAGSKRSKTCQRRVGSNQAPQLSSGTFSWRRQRERNGSPTRKKKKGLPLMMAAPPGFKRRSCLQSVDFRYFPILCFFFVSPPLFPFPSTLVPHHKRLALYATVLIDERRVTPSFGLTRTHTCLLLHCPFFLCTHYCHRRLLSHCTFKNYDRLLAPFEYCHCRFWHCSAFFIP
jgi:hypothetical protein